MKLGISSFTFSWAVGVKDNMPENPMTFRDLIEQTKAYGLTLLQIGDNLPLHQLSPSEIEEAKTLADAYGIDIEIGTRGLTDEVLEQYLSYAVQFSSPILRIVIDQGAYEPTAEEVINKLKKWMPRFEENNVILAIENHDRFEVKTLRMILESVGSKNVGICLDAANSMGALEGVEAVSDELMDYVVNLHIKDINIRRLPSQLGFKITGSPAGSGGIDLPRLVGRARRIRSDVNMILEQWVPFETDIEQTIAKEKRSADQSVEYLKTLLPPVREISEPVIGASALYTISKYGPKFTADDICASLTELGKLGIRSFQPELSFETAMDEWTDEKIAELNRRQVESKVEVHQMICHFILDYFQSEQQIFSDNGYRQIPRFLQLCKKVNNCEQVLFPIGPLSFKEEHISAERVSRILRRYIRKLCDFARMAQDAGFRVVFEMLPGNFIGSYNALFDALEHKGLKDFGLNFDTAHAIANGEEIYTVAETCGQNFFLSHFGDPIEIGGPKHVPGKGMIDWKRLFSALQRGGFDWKVDLEIASDPEHVDRDYLEGKEYLEKTLNALKKA